MKVFFWKDFLVSVKSISDLKTIGDVLKTDSHANHILKFLFSCGALPTSVCLCVCLLLIFTVINRVDTWEIWNLLASISVRCFCSND